MKWELQSYFVDKETQHWRTSFIKRRPGETNLAMPLSHCVIIAKLFNLSVPHSFLSIEGENNIGPQSLGHNSEIQKSLKTEVLFINKAAGDMLIPKILFIVDLKLKFSILYFRVLSPATAASHQH